MAHWLSLSNRNLNIDFWPPPVPYKFCYNKSSIRSIYFEDLSYKFEDPAEVRMTAVSVSFMLVDYEVKKKNKVLQKLLGKRKV